MGLFWWIIPCLPAKEIQEGNIMARTRPDTPRNPFVLICSVLLLLAVCSGCMSAAAHYRKHKDKPSLYAVLRDTQPGTTREHLKALLGSETYESKSHREGVHGLFKTNPGKFPQGLLATDAIIFYPYDELGLETLIFREGRLINHDQSKYLKP